KVVDEWSSQFFDPETPRARIDGIMPLDGREYMVGDAPLAEMDLGTVEVVEDAIADGVRRVTVAITPAHDTAEYYLWAPAETPVRASWINGEAFAAGDRLPLAQWFVQMRGRF